MPLDIIKQRPRMQLQRELGRGKFRAQQIAEEIMVTATGDTPTPNYKVWLQLGPEQVSLPITELWWMRPAGIQPQVLTPFRVHLTFHVGNRKVDQIKVRDADGLHNVQVEHGQPATPTSGQPGASQRLLANSFRLMLDKTPVSYATTSLIGEPIMNIGGRQFTGDELLIEDTALGQQVTVVTEQIPDLKTVTFTLIVPPVLLDGIRPAKIEIPGVTATHHTTIAGPPLGQGISHDLATLRGVAEFIVA